MAEFQISQAELAQKIDHTLLKPDLLTAELQKTCEEANIYQFKTVCIPPSWVQETKKILAQLASSTEKTTEKAVVKTITVVGFPLGYSTTSAKIAETEQALKDGAEEIDLVINISLIKNQRFDEAQKDIEAVAKICRGIPLKVILETAYLTSDEKITAARIAEAAGAQYIKTSTGFALSGAQTGATVEDIRLFRKILKPETKIKASGGIRDTQRALEMLQAGADRIGTSASVAIVSGLIKKTTQPETSREGNY